MNYLTHALPHLESADPYFLAGTAVPDWISVVNRRVRVRPRLLELFRSHHDSHVAALAAGIQRHFDDDGWFHGTRAFAEVSAQLGNRLNDRLGGEDGFRCGFLGHVGMELLIDAVLSERYPLALDQYYVRLRDVDAAEVERLVGEMAGAAPDGLSWLIDLFRQMQFLRDYADDVGLLGRLNQVLMRVKLATLPADATDWLAESRVIVRDRLTDLLPTEHYPWPR